MSQDVIIPNQERLEGLKKKILEDGVDNLHVLSDFDRTLTKAFVDGKSTPSLISVLRDGNYLTSDYAQKAQALYEKYNPIDINPSIPIEEKKKAMEEWWMTHFDLLIKSGLTKKDLESVVESGKIKTREGFGEFVDFLWAHKIPLVIMSSSGLGGDCISMYFEKENRLYENIHIISNAFEWDENGRAIRIKQPIIHNMNKDDTAIQDFPVFDIIENRKNVLLLGDRPADIEMIKGFDCKNIIKIGFLNEDIERDLEQFKNSFDVVISGDSSLDYANKLLK
ncbi:MAG: hypothetical protein HY764_01050 [Candidatus Portnoybacteria bacterium]|nr:hypothetical protein [Candidatus Portnoybacteria bacterium]